MSTSSLLASSARYFYDDAAAREPVTGNAHPRGHGVNPKAATWPAGWSAEHGGHGGIPRGAIPAQAERQVRKGGRGPRRHAQPALGLDDRDPALPRLALRDLPRAPGRALHPRRFQRRGLLPRVR